MSTSQANRLRFWQVIAIVVICVLLIGSLAVPLFFRGEAGETLSDPARAGATEMPGRSGGDDITATGDYSGFIENSTGSQVSYLSLDDGHRVGTATERFARPALSLGKLYIADYVFSNGTLEEKYLAVDMITSSSDTSAETLYERYPESIDEIAKKYGLLSTRGAEKWGYSVTSTYDAVSFIAELLQDDPTSPILVAMASAHGTAADGYSQDFGTGVLPGVLGTKWGWSDDRQLHSSVSFGSDYVVAAAVTGSADDLTQLVQAQAEQLGIEEHLSQKRG